MGRLGVPCFLMISGSLLLPRKYGADNIKRFWKKSWFHLFICTVFWFVVCELFMVQNKVLRQLAGKNAHHIIEGAFKSVAHSLKDAVAIDPEFADEIPSTKGVL